MAEVTEMHNGYASKGIANTGLGFGIAGTALSLLGNHVGGWGFGNGYGRNGYGYEGGAYCIDRPVGRETFELQQRMTHLESENAILRSEQAEDKKLVDVYTTLDKKINENARRDENSWNEQLVWNARQDSRIAVLESKMHEMFDLTGRYVEASRVTPMPMNRYNSWTAPVTADAPATT